MSGNKISSESFHKLDDPRRELILSKRKLFKALGDLRNKAVADLGSGTGYYTKDLVKLTRPLGAVYCLDVNDELLDILKTRTIKLDRIQYIPMDEASIPIDDHQIDAVLSVMTAHEFNDPYDTFNEIKRIMKTGGNLVIADWSPYGKLNEGPPKDIRLSEDNIIKHATDAGFEFVKNFSGNSELYILLFTA